MIDYKDVRIVHDFEIDFKRANEGFLDWWVFVSTCFIYIIFIIIIIIMYLFMCSC